MKRGVAIFAVVVILIVLIGIVKGPKSAPPAEEQGSAAPATSRPVVSSGEAPRLDAKQCSSVLEALEGEKLIGERPSPDRIDVEDALWAQLPAKDKRGLVGILGCAAFGGRALDQLGPQDTVFIHAYRSGEMLASGTRFGARLK